MDGELEFNDYIYFRSFTPRTLTLGEKLIYILPLRFRAFLLRRDG